MYDGFVAGVEKLGRRHGRQHRDKKPQAPFTQTRPLFQGWVACHEHNMHITCATYAYLFLRALLQTEPGYCRKFMQTQTLLQGWVACHAYHTRIICTSQAYLCTAYTHNMHIYPEGMPFRQLGHCSQFGCSYTNTTAPLRVVDVSCTFYVLHVHICNCGHAVQTRLVHCRQLGCISHSSTAAHAASCSS